MTPAKQDEVITVDNPSADESSPLLSKSSKVLPSSNTAITGRDTKSEAIGLTLMALCALTSSSMFLFAKLCGTSFPSFEVVLFRSAGQTILCLVACYWIGINPLGERNVRVWLMLRGITGGLSLAANFYSVTHLPLADAAVIMYLNPAFTTILAALFLNEPFRWFEGLCVTLCLFGSVLVTKPGFLLEDDSSGQHYGGIEKAFTIFVALLGAFFTAACYIVIRKAGNAAHFLAHTFYFGVTGILMSALPLLTFQPFVTPESWRERSNLLMTGISAFATQCLLNKGLQMAPVGPASVMRMNEIVLSFIFGITIFDEYPDPIGVAGAVIILTTTTALGSRKWRSAKKSSR